jgi:acetyltransferase-like isoleucine patch superfamily enzyme
VGKKAKTGAGAVVTRGTTVKDGSVYVGVPAKELKRK